MGKWLACLVLAVVWARPAEAQTPVSPSVRGTNPDVTGAITSAWEQSPTFRQLEADIRRAGGLVYVHRGLRGRNAQGKDGAAGRPTVFVHIQNQAAVPPEIVAGARDQLMHLFDDAGVHVESYVDVDHDRCGRPLTIHVIVLGGASADRFIKTEQVGRKVLAQANSTARRVYVFWERLGPAVDRQAVARGDALGLLIAHELGHVLLPGRGHSQDGLMQANYDAYLSYGLKFDLQQSAALRAFVTAASCAPTRGPCGDTAKHAPASTRE